MISIFSISRTILLFSIISVAGHFSANAQDVDSMSSYMGYKGYTTYQNQNENVVGMRMPPYYGNPKPINETFIYDAEQSVIVDYDRKELIVDSDNNVSRLEGFYRDRTNVQSLTQFGYDLFYTAKIEDKGDEEKRQHHTSPAGAVQSDYIVQAGDEINVIFSGERQERAVYLVESDGRLLISGLPAVTAMGRSLQALREDIENALLEVEYRGDVDVTVSAIRQIGVLIAGHVFKPGRQNLNAYHSILDALNQAGGIKKTGSLRNIKLVRNGVSQIFDLYRFITFNNYGSDVLLQDGDRIIVPPVGATIAVVGDVKQAGVFELQSIYTKPQAVSLNEALAMAGGPLGGGNYRFTMMSGNGEVINIGENSRAIINDGGVIEVTRATDRLTNGIEVKGYSRQNGTYDLASAETLRMLMGDRQIFGDDTYPLIGVIGRTNRNSLTRNLMAFSPQSVAKGKDDRQLEAGDRVYLFSYADIDKIKNSNDYNEENEFPKSVNQYVLDHSVMISGAVREEGAWPVGTSTDLQTLISVSGGLTSKANRTDIEITSRNIESGDSHRRHKMDVKNTELAEIILEPGDQVRINEKFEEAVEKSVRITGEIKQPGTYNLMRGDTLLSLMERAGGITLDAYPPAAVFSRKAERRREEQRFRSAAQELEQTVSVNLNAQDKGATLTPAQISMARKLAEDLRSVQAIGRVMVEADPAVLSVRPEVNMLLEDGDHLHIPKRSLNVRVSGEVMNPVSLLYGESLKPDDYIRQAGGTTYFADKGRSFVVYPDGSAQPLGRSGWNLNDTAMIIPGSTIILPRDPKPFNFMDSFKDITQILSNLAITGVFIEDIANDNN